MPFISIFSFYGGKSKVSRLYPSPVHRQIIEPFAGAAAYSLRYSEHDVWLNDLSPRVFSAWDFLINNPDAEAWISMIPESIEVGAKITERFGDFFPIGLLEILCGEANQGTAGHRPRWTQVTKLGARCWPRLKPRLLYWLPRIAHWRLTNLPYEQIPNTAATWFIDPPYDNAAGRRYACQVEDYQALADFCRSRLGQTIVCENMGATWLPFRPLTERRGVRSRYQLSRAMEAIWEGEGAYGLEEAATSHTAESLNADCQPLSRKES